MPAQMGNLAVNMKVPAYLRRKYLKTLDDYDNRWQPLFLNMMPKRMGEGRGSKHYFTRPRTANPQMMAKYYEPMERVEPMNVGHVRVWNYNTRTLAESFVRHKNMFFGDFEGGIMEREHGKLLARIPENINRALEYTLSRFAYGDTEVMAEFTTQDLNRQAVVRLNNGQFNGVAATGDLYGLAWDDFSGGAGSEPEVFKELAFLIERFEFINLQSPTTLIIGRKTALALEKNNKLLERLINFRDTTDGILGGSIQGLTIVKVVGQTYKDAPEAEVEAEGMPGRGDYLEMDWNRINRHDMMVEEINGVTWEWGILTNGNAGEVACGYVDDDHVARGSPTNIFVEQWEEKNPKQIVTMGKLNVCPVVDDYARIMLIRTMAQQ